MSGAVPSPRAAPPGRGRALALTAAVAVAVVSSFAYLRLDLGGLLEPGAGATLWHFVAEFLRPEASGPFVRATAWATLQTLCVSALGTLLAGLAAAVLALPASGRWGAAARAATLLGLNVLRCVPELVWASLTVLAVGLGPFAGVLALALHTAGVFGRLFGQTLENAPAQAAAALREAGASPWSAFAYGTLPQVLAQWVAYALYRWEINVRVASVLGFVGAGGLGQMLYLHLSLFQQARAATVLIAMFALALVVDSLSGRVRRGLTPAYA